jgi:hypothetical protein
MMIAAAKELTEAAEAAQRGFFFLDPCPVLRSMLK